MEFQRNKETQDRIHSVANQAIQRKPNKTGLPDNLKSGIENLSGHSMDDVKVHYNSSRPAQLHAHAFAQGNQIHLASGQEKHLPHEAWHVVQQKQGRVRPTLQLKSSVPINDDLGLEKEADVMGQKAIGINGRIPTQRKQSASSANLNLYQFQWNRVPEKKYEVWDSILDGKRWFRTVGSDGYLYSRESADKKYPIKIFLRPESIHDMPEQLMAHAEEMNAAATGISDQIKATAPTSGRLATPETFDNSRLPAKFSQLPKELLLYILHLSAEVENVFGKPVAHRPGVLSKLMKVNKSFYLLIKNNPESVGFYLKSINAINQDMRLERVAKPSMFGGKHPQIMNPREMSGLVSSANHIAKIFPPAKYAYVSLGNSPAIVTTYLKQRGATVLPLPLSGVSREGLEEWEDPVKRKRMLTYLNHFVPPSKLKGKLPVVIDVSASGDSLRVTRFMLSKYYESVGYETQVTMLALNKKDIEMRPLTEEIGQERAVGLPGGPSSQDYFLDQILEKFYKEGIKYLMWNRTEMIYIFRGERIEPEVRAEYYQRMLIETKRVEEVLNELKELS